MHAREHRRSAAACGKTHRDGGIHFEGAHRSSEAPAAGIGSIDGREESRELKRRARDRELTTGPIAAGIRCRARDRSAADLEARARCGGTNNRRRRITIVSCRDRERNRHEQVDTARTTNVGRRKKRWHLGVGDGDGE